MEKQKHKIKELRVRHGFTQKQVADKIGVTVPTYLKLEKDMSTISIKRLNQLAEVFNVELKVMLDNTDIA